MVIEAQGGYLKGFCAKPLADPRGSKMLRNEITQDVERLQRVAALVLQAVDWNDLALEDLDDAVELAKRQYAQRKRDRIRLADHDARQRERQAFAEGAWSEAVQRAIRAGAGEG